MWSTMSRNAVGMRSRSIVARSWLQTCHDSRSASGMPPSSQMTVIGSG